MTHESTPAAEVVIGIDVDADSLINAIRGEIEERINAAHAAGRLTVVVNVKPIDEAAVCRKIAAIVNEAADRAAAQIRTEALTRTIEQSVTSPPGRSTPR